MLSNKNIESGIEEGVKRLFIRITRETLPRIADKYPFLYLERGRLEVDDSSVRWIAQKIVFEFLSLLLPASFSDRGQQLPMRLSKQPVRLTACCAGQARILFCFMQQVFHPLLIREICRGRQCCQ